MGTVLTVVAFAAFYSVGAYLQSYVAVYHLEMIDPKFGTADSNFAISLQVLPTMVTIVTLSFLAGVSAHHSWLRRKGPVFATANGALIAVACSFAGFAFL